MGASNLDLPISNISGIGPRRAAILERRGIKSLRDLLYNFPRAYKNLLEPQNISELNVGQEAVIKSEIISIASQRLFRRRMTVTNAVAQDNTGIINLVWFNQPYISGVLKEGESYLLYGKVTLNRKTGAIQMASPKYERIVSLVPIYSETEGLSSKQLRIVMSAATRQIEKIKDDLPESVKNRYSLISLGEALKQIHHPQSSAMLEKARRRLAFDELLTVVNKFMEFDRELVRRRAPKVKINEKSLKEFVSRLPYKLTDEQRLAAWRIIKKMADEGMSSTREYSRSDNKLCPEQRRRATKGTAPLNALLNGDVGSGKTIVALLASLGAVGSGLSAIWLAPTQILARQHFETVKQLLSNADANIELITAGINPIRVNPRKHPRQSASIIIGTHALLHRKDQFSNVGLVVVDEQHRFGVEQRRALLSADAKTKLTPHFLSMTATPIPRSLAMMLSGMTDLITIKSKPVGRKKIITKVVTDESRNLMYRSIEKEIVCGRQVYVIVPLIEDPPSHKATEGFAQYQIDLGSKKAAAHEVQNLKKIFPKRRIGLLHGKIKSAEKDKVMNEMANHKLDILVSTTVVEVGIDIPNATVIVIENANYFGLAQLHQLRGRVGRSNFESYCYLSVSGDIGAVARERLKIMEQSGDGFVIAQKDLELRGPGTIIGTQQAGFFDLRLASLGDTMLIEQAKEAAQIIKSQLT